MKKIFLVFGVMGALCAINGYADVAISQTDEMPDMTVSVARATRGETKAKENGKTLPEGAAVKRAVADGNPTGGASLILNCPAACTPNCGIMSNLLICNGCKYSDGTYCPPIDAVASADLEVKQPEKK